MLELRISKSKVYDAYYYSAFLSVSLSLIFLFFLGFVWHHGGLLLGGGLCLACSVAWFLWRALRVVLRWFDLLSGWSGSDGPVWLLWARCAFLKLGRRERLGGGLGPQALSTLRTCLRGVA